MLGKNNHQLLDLAVSLIWMFIVTFSRAILGHCMFMGLNLSVKCWVAAGERVSRGRQTAG